ncbi:MAG: FkbM family methyltransferase [Methylocystaceae bacterium]|nr:FkbM family methyltransferase [Methylocystaceae bacterium]
MKKRYILGAGIQGNCFHTAFNKENISLDGFLDNFSTKPHYNDLPVLKPEELKTKDAEIYISVGLYSEKIKSDLEAKGFTNVFSYTQSVLKIPTIIHELKHHSLWYSAELEKRVNLEKLSEFKSLLVDKKSKQLLDQIIRFRTDFKAEDYIIPDIETQYFAKDVPVFEQLNSLRFIDAGAYIGDTVQSLLKQNVPIEYIASFEPDPFNLEKLHQTIKSEKIPDTKTRFFVYPGAVWSKHEILHFQMGQKASSHLETDHLDQETVTAVTGFSLDQCLKQAQPNFIKMDVEGAEISALEGAKCIIKEYSPVLAISLYHKPSDLWEIPQKIHELNDGYDMYLRVYGDMLLETVLYCIPKI